MQVFKVDGCPATHPHADNQSEQGADRRATNAGSGYPLAGALSGLRDINDDRRADVSVSPGNREATLRPGRSSDGAGIEPMRPSPGFSQATVAGTPYRIDEDTPAAGRQFLSQALSNNSYVSDTQFKARAENYLAYIGAEKKLIERAHSSLHDIQSPAFRQSSWLCHLERGVWQSEPALERFDREQLGNEVVGTAKAGPSSPYAKPRPWSLSPVSASAFSMMLKGEAGPFTSEQAKTGFETVQEGLLLACDLKIPERKAYRADNRHDARRNGTHATKTPTGTDLSQDEGTRMRDAFKVPVMLGTSGSSSDVALAGRFGAERAGLSWEAPELNRDTAKAAMVELALQFFRTEASSPTVTLARKMNEIRSKVGLPAKEVEAHQVFTHSYAEIHAGINLTLESISPKDPQAVEQALTRLTTEAKEHLDAAKAG